MKKIKILLLSAGSLVGHNILECMAERVDDFFVVGTNSVAESASLRGLDRVYLVPETRNHQAFEAKFKDICEIEKPDLIIPCRDDDVVFLAHMKSKISFKCLSGSRQLAEMMNDQWLSYLFARENHLSFSPTILLKAESDLRGFIKDFGFPLIAKPRFGYASRGIKVITSLDAIEYLLQESDYVLQQYIGIAKDAMNFCQQAKIQGLPLFYSFEQYKYSLQCLIKPDASISEMCLTLHQMSNGKSVQVSRFKNKVLEQLATQAGKIFAKLGWQGPLNIQCLQNEEGEFFIHEFNGRLTGATSARYFLGFDEVGFIIREFVSRNYSVMRHLQANTSIDKYLTSYSLPQEFLIALNQKGVWSRK